MVCHAGIGSYGTESSHSTEVKTSVESLRDKNRESLQPQICLSFPTVEAHTCVKPSCRNPKCHNTKVTPYISAILREDLTKLLAVKEIPS